MRYGVAIIENAESHPMIIALVTQSFIKGLGLASPEQEWAAQVPVGDKPGDLHPLVDAN